MLTRCKNGGGVRLFAHGPLYLFYVLQYSVQYTVFVFLFCLHFIVCNEYSLQFVFTHRTLFTIKYGSS